MGLSPAGLQLIAALRVHAEPDQPQFSQWNWNYDVTSAVARIPLWKFYLMSRSYSILTFDGVPEQLADVRERVHQIVGDVDGVEDVVLVVSELAANAIRHSFSGCPGGRFVLEVAEFKDAWHVRVSDQGGPASPTLGTAAGGDETGRGLPVVIALARAWGVIGDSAGRTVWAEIPFPEDDVASELHQDVMVHVLQKPELGVMA